jgi:hydrogenase-4 membrane subunit HyfE
MCRSSIISDGLRKRGQFKGFLSYGHSVIITRVAIVPDCVTREIRAESEEKFEHQE